MRWKPYFWFPIKQWLAVTIQLSEIKLPPHCSISPFLLLAQKLSLTVTVLAAIVRQIALKRTMIQYAYSGAYPFMNPQICYPRPIVCSCLPPIYYFQMDFTWSNTTSGLVNIPLASTRGVRVQSNVITFTNDVIYKKYWKYKNISHMSQK